MSGAAPPATPALARQRLTETDIPAAVVEVCACLARAGHAAVLVGGAVRDALLGRVVSDWDVATSATPTEVMALFRRTIPTGVQHGTVTALVGERGTTEEPVEITTFRGEGEYLDGRRPSSVEFLRSLHDDLARRDLTINAIAWDPVGAVLTDPFGGLADLHRGIIVAVGDPTQRFTEDGLRTMRAVRFCATLAMALDPATAAAIPAALDVLAKVSRERVYVELTKMLKAPRPSLGLVPMAETGIWPYVLPPLAAEVREAAVRAADALPCDPVLRLACLLRPAALLPDGEKTVGAAVVALKTSKLERARLAVLTGPAMVALEQATSGPEIRRAVSRLSRANLDDALAVLASDTARRDAVHDAVDHAPLSIKELAVRGGDLIALGLATPGPALGDTMDALLAWAMEDPARNVHASLVARARETMP